MTFQIELKEFEGPMDLLLHLIRKNKLDIMNIPILLITEQYLDYVNQAEKLNLKLSTEFAVFTSILLEIKSKLLLPMIEDDEDDENLEEELLKNLQEYHKVKLLIDPLLEKRNEASLYFSRNREFNYQLLEPEVNFNDFTLMDLYLAWHRLKKRDIEEIYEEVPVEDKIYRDPYPVKTSINHIMNIFEKQKVISFSSFLQPEDSANKVVSYFLAVLELIKLNYCTAQLNRQNQLEIVREESA